MRPNAGIDVSKQHLDACCEDQERRWVNDASGWDGLTAMLKAHDVDLVVVEASGGYERGVVCALQGAGIEVARVNPRQARDCPSPIASMRAVCATSPMCSHAMRSARRTSVHRRTNTASCWRR